MLAQVPVHDPRNKNQGVWGGYQYSAHLNSLWGAGLLKRVHACSEQRMTIQAVETLLLRARQVLPLLEHRSLTVLSKLQHVLAELVQSMGHVWRITREARQVACGLRHTVAAALTCACRDAVCQPYTGLWCCAPRSDASGLVWSSMKPAWLDTSAEAGTHKRKPTTSQNVMAVFGARCLGGSSQFPLL